MGVHPVERIRAARREMEVAARVAKLYYEDNLTQEQIAELVGISRSSISRLLTAARAAGIVEIRVNAPPAEDHAQEEALEQRFGLRHAVVVTVLNTGDSALIRRNIGHFAARIVSRWVTSGQVVGVGQGRTLHELVSRMAPVERLEAISAVQLLGDVGPFLDDQRSSEVTRLFAQRFGAVAYYLTAPAIVDSPTVRAGLLATPGIAHTLAMYGRLDVALLGVGAILDSPLTHGGLISLESARRLAAQGIVADIAGHFLDVGGGVRATEFDDRVMGISIDALRSCPMVVVVAGGPEKVVPLLAALRSGLVHAVVTDRQTAEGVLEAADRRA